MTRSADPSPRVRRFVLRQPAAAETTKPSKKERRFMDWVLPYGAVRTKTQANDQRGMKSEHRRKLRCSYDSVTLADRRRGGRSSCTRGPPSWPECGSSALAARHGCSGNGPLHAPMNIEVVRGFPGAGQAVAVKLARLDQDIASRSLDPIVVEPEHAVAHSHWTRRNEPDSPRFTSVVSPGSTLMVLANSGLLTAKDRSSATHNARR